MNFKSFYESNIKMLYTKKELDNFNNIYVYYYNKVNSFDELMSKFPVNLHDIIKYEFHKQFETQKGIQGGVLVELTILTTMANFFGIYNFSYDNGKYIYENDKYIFILQGNSGHGGLKDGNDIKIFDKVNNKWYNCEVKEPFARFDEMDWFYTEEGKLCPSKRADKNKLPLFWPIANAYNAHMSVFDHIGHNYPLTEEMVKEIVSDYFGNVDYILTFTEKDNYFLIIPNNKEIFNLIYSYKGSEIRTVSGKNLKCVFTPVYAKTVLDKYLIKEDNEYYYFNVNDFIYTLGRQNSNKGRYKLVEGFAILQENAIIENNILKCEKKYFKQNSAVISPKIKLISDYNKIKDIIMQGEDSLDK